jgi:hypothetical protein
MADGFPAWPAPPFELQRYSLHDPSPVQVEQLQPLDSVSRDPAWMYGLQNSPPGTESLEPEMPRTIGWQAPDLSSNNVQRHSAMRTFPTQGSNSHSLRLNPPTMPPRQALPYSPRHELPAKPAAAPLATATRKPVEGDCPVCWEAFEPDQTILYCKTTCGNNFHRTCFVDWVTTPKNRLTPNAVRCPMCRGMWDEEELRHIQLENGVTPYKPKKVPRRAMDRVREQYRIHRRRSLEQNPGPWSRAGRPATVASRISVDLPQSALPGSPHSASPRFRDLPGWSIRYSPGMQQAQPMPAPVNNGNQNLPTQDNHNLPRFQMPQPTQTPTSNPMNRAPGSDWVSSGWMTFPNQYQPGPPFGGAPQPYDPMQSMQHGHPASQSPYPQYNPLHQTPRYTELPTFNTMVPQQQQPPPPQQQHPCPAMRNSYQASNEVAPTMNYLPGIQDVGRPYPTEPFHQQQPYEYIQYHFSQTYTAWHA